MRKPAPARASRTGAAPAAVVPSVPLLARMELHILAIVFLGFCAYGTTFRVPFIFDDQTAIVDNPTIRSLANFFPFQGYHDNPRRFVGYLSFALNFRLHGLWLPGYHLTNLAIHLGAALSVYTLVRLTLTTPRLQGSRLRCDAPLLAAVVALLFVAHPLQTQAVTYIVQRLASLATLWYLLTLTLYAAARIRMVRHGRSDGAALGLAGGALLTMLLALFTKEIAYTLPAMLALYEGIFFPGSRRRTLCAVLLAFAVTGAVLVWVGTAPRPLGQLFADLDASLSESRAISRTGYLLTQFGVIATYLRLLLVPVGQNLDYAYPVATSLLAPRPAAGLLVLTALAAAGGWCLRRSGRGADPGYRLVAFGIFWFFIALTVESSIIPISDVIFEHRVYLPAAGLFMAAATVAFLAGTERRRTLVLAGLAVIVVALTLAARLRNGVWRDGEVLWQDVIAKSPGKARPHNELAKIYFDRQRFPEAIAQARAALDIDPTFLPAHVNLGAAYQRVGDLDAAIAECEYVLQRQPQQAETRNSLGNALKEKGELDRAIVQFEAALKARPDYAAAHNNLGAAYRNQGRTDAAVAQYLIALQLKPDYASAHHNLGIAYAVQGRLDDAIAAIDRAIRLQPDRREFRETLAKVYELKGLPEQAAAVRRANGAPR